MLWQLAVCCLTSAVSAPCAKSWSAWWCARKLAAGWAALAELGAELAPAFEQVLQQLGTPAQGTAAERPALAACHALTSAASRHGQEQRVVEVFDALEQVRLLCILSAGPPRPHPAPAGGGPSAGAAPGRRQPAHATWQRQRALHPELAVLPAPHASALVTPATAWSWPEPRPAQAGLHADTAIFNMLLRAVAARGDSAERLQRSIQAMAAHGASPDMHTHVILLQACAGQGNAALAASAWQALLSSGKPPDMHTHVLLLRTSADKGNAGLAGAAWQALLSSPPHPPGGAPSQLLH